VSKTLDILKGVLLVQIISKVYNNRLQRYRDRKFRFVAKAQFLVVSDIS